MGIVKTVLFADDDNALRLAIKDFFEDSSLFVFDFAENGVVALDKSLSHTYDIIVLDIAMPFMNGKEALKTIRAKNSSLPVVAFTGTVDDVELDSLEKLGFTKVLTKPVELSYFNKILDDIANKRNLEPENKFDNSLNQEIESFSSAQEKEMPPIQEREIEPVKEEENSEDELAEFSFANLINKSREYLIQNLQQKGVENIKLQKKINNLENQLKNLNK